MDISEENFKKIQSVLGEITKFPIQKRILDDLGFDLGSDCDNYIGKYFPDNEWKNPDPDRVYEFFERTLLDYEPRYQKFLKSPMLSLDELESFKDLRKTDYEENEWYPGIFIGTVKFNQSELIVFSSRRGSGWEGLEIDLLGIFETREDGESVLFVDGEII